MLHSAASFSVYASGDGDGEGERDGMIEREIMMGMSGDGGVERSVTIGDRLSSCDSGEFSFVKNNIMDMDMLIEEEEEAISHGVAAGDIEGYFKNMVIQYPSNALFLRNYAHLLQSKGELESAKEYYLKATIADPSDGEILLLYAKLVWELHRDYKTASDYFQRAALAAPNDSNIQAEFARFLWEEGESEDDDETQQKGTQLPLADTREAVEDLEVVDVDKKEEYFERAIQANPYDSDTLAAYARFLWETDCHDDEIILK